MTISPAVPATQTSRSFPAQAPRSRRPEDRTAASAPLPYHRLAHLRPQTRRWWRPLTALALCLGLGTAGLLLVMAAGEIATALHWMPGSTPDLSDSGNPSDYLIMLGTLAVLVPTTLLGIRWGWRRVGTVHSVTGRFRWGLAARAAAVVGPAFVIINWGQAWLLAGDELSWPPLNGRLVSIMIIVIMLTPFQCAAEEYLFRALPQQILGTWLRSPVWGIVLPVPLFVLGHGYDWVGQIDIALFGLAMGFLVWKSGGVELAIVVHAANNLTLFLLAPLSATSLLQGEVDPRLLLITLPALAVITAGLTWWISRRHRIGLMEPVRR